MRFQPRRLVLLCLVALLAAGVLYAAAKKDKKTSKSASEASPMDDRKKALHALNRLTFGARPGDLEQVQSMGLDKWIDQQLHPEKINDDALQARLADFNTLRMSTEEMIRNFPPPQIIKAVENGRIKIPSDPEERAIYEAQLERYKARQDNKQQAGNDVPAEAEADANANMTVNAEGQMVPAAGTSTQTTSTQAASAQSMDGQNAGDGQMADNGQPAPRKLAKKNETKNELRNENRGEKALEDKLYADIDGSKILQLPPEERVKAILKMAPEERQDFIKSLNGEERNQLADGLSGKQRETVMALVAPQQVVQSELTHAKLLRAVYSNRQLEEVMTDFWFNHFNVYIDKGLDRYLITAYERDVIRPHALGKFKDLLLATAKSPAMLFYLDNWQSIGPNSDFAKNGGRRPNRRGGFRRGAFGMPPQAAQAQNKKRASGLNENYAREVMELHTLGVDGGYTQADVTELAKVLTGWSLDQPYQKLGGGYRFEGNRHEPGKKVVLKTTFKEDGEKEGEQALDMLAHHPATARFISKKLAIRFVSDDPPQSLIDKMAQTFQSSDGDIREVLKTMVDSPEFWAEDTYRAKVKTPLEFIASAARATGADIEKPQPLVENLRKMGMPLYGMQPPTGYSNKAEKWVNSEALIDRMNFGLALGTGRLRGTVIDMKALGNSQQEPADLEQALAMMEGALLSGEVSAQTHAALLKQLSDPNNPMLRPVSDDKQQGPRLGLIAGMVLGSPEFQRR